MTAKVDLKINDEVRKMLMIAVDVGTTNSKVLVFDQMGKVRAKAENGYHLISRAPGQAEEDPELIWQAIKKGLSEVAGAVDEEATLCFSTAMHSLLAINQNKAISPLFTWADTRSARYATENLKAFALASGVPLHPMIPLVKLAWLKAENKPLYEKAEKWLDLKSFLMSKFTGEYVTDYACAGSFGLLDCQSMHWNRDAMNELGLSNDQLPRIVATKTIFPIANKKLLEELGLNIKHLVIGASDGTLSNLAQEESDHSFSITIGTSAAVRGAVDHLALDPQNCLFTYRLDNKQWVMGAPSNNGGNILAWWQKIWNISYEQIGDSLTEALIGASGVRFYPYLYGERAPLWDANVTGKMLGLSANITQSEMIRGVVEGMLFNIRSNYDLLVKILSEPQQINLSGGACRLKGLPQMLADIIGLPVKVASQADSSATGAAMLAYEALGVTMPLNLGNSQLYLPDKTAHESYELVYQNWLTKR